LGTAIPKSPPSGVKHFVSVARFGVKFNKNLFKLISFPMKWVMLRPLGNEKFKKVLNLFYDEKAFFDTYARRSCTVLEHNECFGQRR
jgi:hypothetical protein